MSLFSKLKIGSEYMELWPDEKVVRMIFMEPRLKEVYSFAKKALPPFIALILVWMYYTCGGFQGIYVLLTHPSAGFMHMYLALTSLIMMTLVLLSSPFFMLLWFYYHSQKPLEPKQRAFYQDLCSKLQKQPSSAPIMYDFVKTLNEACKTLKDKEFLNKL